MPNLELILMPSMACNMVCDYCYVLNKHSGFMSLDMAKQAIADVVTHNSPHIVTKVYWHGAEPLLAGIDFFREMFAWSRNTYGIDGVAHHIQTNGTLLNDEWYDLFIEGHVTVGVSLDGPQSMHDAHRTFHNGKGTFDKILRNILEARKRKLYFDVLCVITRNTIGHEDELFDFFSEHKIDFGFEPLTPENDWMVENLSITPDEYADTVIRIFDRWYLQSERRLCMVVPPYHFLMSIMTGTNTFCHFSENCTRHYLAVNPLGNVFSCIMYARYPELSFGNIMRHSLDTILESPTRKRFLAERADVVAHCSGCRWYSVCHGGCPHHAFVHHGTTDKRDPLCPAYKKIFSHISDKLGESLDDSASSNGENTLNPFRTASCVSISRV